MTTETIQSDVSNNAANSIYETLDDGADALLNRWQDKAEPSSKKREEEEVEEKEPEEALEEETQDTETDEAEEDDSEEEQEQESDQDADESEESEEDETKEEQEQSPKSLKDDDEVEIIVDKETRKVALKDLKRLYGQEASLTRKSQEVAAQRKAVEADATKYAAGLDALYKRAQARWEPYSKVDMLLAAKELSTEEFTVLRKEAQEAYDEFQFVSKEADKFMQDAQAQQQERVKAEAKKAVEVLKEKIPDWSDDLYNRIRSYAVSQGADPVRVSQATDPSLLIMLNKSRLFDEGQKVVLKKKVKTPTKVIKSSNTTAADITPDKTRQAMKRLRTSGDTDSAADAFLARWQA